jgi:hypothetical protein
VPGRVRQRRSRDGRAGRLRSCATCHARDFCASCHVNAPEPVIRALAPDQRSLAIGTALRAPAPHRQPTFLTSQGAEAGASRATCAACHARSQCRMSSSLRSGCTAEISSGRFPPATSLFCVRQAKLLRGLPQYAGVLYVLSCAIRPACAGPARGGLSRRQALLPARPRPGGPAGTGIVCVMSRRARL